MFVSRTPPWQHFHFRLLMKSVMWEFLLFFSCCRRHPVQTMPSDITSDNHFRRRFLCSSYNPLRKILSGNTFWQGFHFQILSWSVPDCVSSTIHQLILSEKSFQQGSSGCRHSQFYCSLVLMPSGISSSVIFFSFFHVKFYHTVELCLVGFFISDFIWVLIACFFVFFYLELCLQNVMGVKPLLKGQDLGSEMVIMMRIYLLIHLSNLPISLRLLWKHQW